MKHVWYIPTVDERNEPLVIKCRVIGSRDGFRMVRQLGSHEDVIVHVRHITQNWLSAWMKAKRISKSRRQRHFVRDTDGTRQRSREIVDTPKRGRDGDDLINPVTAGETANLEEKGKRGANEND